jgi:tRNA G18 (ribose-2'-O)-methylase SpoU
MSEYAMIWGRRPVLEALRGSLRLQKILLIREARGQIVARILELARKRDIPVEMVEKKSFSQYSSQGKPPGSAGIPGSL